ncbi:MAG: hypothetical protein ABI586_09860, partial [Candidatus Nanopelagicales bacterium]
MRQEHYIFDRWSHGMKRPAHPGDSRRESHWSASASSRQVSGAVLTRHYTKLLEGGGHSANSVRGVQGVQPPESGS